MASVSPDESPTQIIVSGTNGEVVSEVTDTKQEQVKSDIPTENEVNSNEPNGSPTQTPVDTEPVSKPKLSAEDYLEKYKINILFEELIFRTLDSTPENPLKFLLSNLETMEKDNWVPGYSQEEKANAVAKIFKTHEADKPVAPKGAGAPVRPGTAGRGATAKTGTNTARAVGGRANTSVRPSPASKSVSSPPKATSSTPRVTNPRTVVKTTTPVKTATTTANRNAPSNATKSVPAKTGTTGAAAKTGSATSLTSSTSKTGITKTSSPGPVPKVTTPRIITPKTTTGPAKSGTTGARTATTGTGTKTGSNTSISKAVGATKTTVRPAATTGRTPAVKTGPASRTPAVRPGIGRNTKAGVTPAKGKLDTPSKGATGSTATKMEDLEKSADPEPEPKAPTPVEEAKELTPEQVEEPKQPEDDGVCSMIKGSDEPEPEPLDPEDQLALDDAVHLSDDENIHVAEKPPSNNQSDDQSDKFPLEDLPHGTEQTDGSADKFMTSENYADDLQAIENEAELVNQGDTLEEFIDEGIEVKEDYTSESDPSFRLRTADEIDNPRASIPTLPPSMENLLGDYTAVKTGENTEITPEPVIDETHAGEIIVAEESKKDSPIEKQQDFQPLVPLEDTTTQPTDQIEQLPGIAEVDIVEASKKDSPIEKQQDFQPFVATEDLIGQTEDTATDPVQEQSTAHRFSEDLGIDMSEKSPVLPPPVEPMLNPFELDPVLQEPSKDEGFTVDLLASNTDPVDNQEATQKQDSSTDPQIIDFSDLMQDKTAQQSNPFINPVQPPTPEEISPAPKLDPPQVPSPDQEDPPTQIEPIFPPITTGDAD